MTKRPTSKRPHNRRKPQKISAQQKVARRVAGLGPKAKLPEKGTEGRRRYDSAMRGFQRAAHSGEINPKTGKAYEARAGKKIKAAAAEIAAEEKALRKGQVHVRDLSVLTTINGDRRYQRRRSLGDVTMTRQQFRAMVRLDKDQDDELLAQLLANVSDKIEDLSLAPGVLTLDLSDVSFSGID